MKGKHALFLLGMLCLALSTYSQVPLFQEQNGLVIIEMESATGSLGDWKKETGISGYTGSGYLVYTGNNQYNNPGQSKISFQVQIQKTGLYRFQWRSRITLGNSNSEHNDSWLRLPDADDFFAQRNNSIVYPKGSGKSPNPKGAGKDGWFKVYQNQKDKWSWHARTSDNDAHDIYARFDQAGIYTLEIAGRSNGHGVDRIILYHEEVAPSDAKDTDLPESDILTGLKLLAAQAALPLKVFPNPANQWIQLQLPEGQAFPAGAIARILDARSAVAATFVLDGSQPVRLPVADLPAGWYVLQVQAPEKLYQTRFIR